MGRRSRMREILCLPITAGVLLLAGGPASANVALTQVSTDPYTNTTSQHRTEVVTTPPTAR